MIDRRRKVAYVIANLAAWVLVFAGLAPSLAQTDAGPAKVADITRQLILKVSKDIPLTAGAPSSGLVYQRPPVTGTIGAMERLKVCDSRDISPVLSLGVTQRWLYVQRERDKVPVAGWIYAGDLGQTSCCLSIVSSSTGDAMQGLVCKE